MQQKWKVFTTGKCESEWLALGGAQNGSLIQSYNPSFDLQRNNCHSHSISVAIFGQKKKMVVVFFCFPSAPVALNHQVDPSGEKSVQARTDWVSECGGLALLSEFQEDSCEWNKFIHGATCREGGRNFFHFQFAVGMIVVGKKCRSILTYPRNIAGKLFPQLYAESRFPSTTNLIQIDWLRYLNCWCSTTTSSRSQPGCQSFNIVIIIVWSGNRSSTYLLCRLTIWVPPKWEEKV